MGAPDKKTVIRELIEQGKSKGQLSTKEILDAIGELDFEPNKLKNFMIHLKHRVLKLLKILPMPHLKTLSLPLSQMKMRMLSLHSVPKGLRLMIRLRSI